MCHMCHDIHNDRRNWVSVFVLHQVVWHRLSDLGWSWEWDSHWDVHSGYTGGPAARTAGKTISAVQRDANHWYLRLFFTPDLFGAFVLKIGTFSLLVRFIQQCWIMQVKTNLSISSHLNEVVSAWLKTNFGATQPTNQPSCIIIHKRKCV